MSKALVHYCFLVFRRIGEDLFLDLFYFVSLTSSCSLTPRPTLGYLTAMINSIGHPILDPAIEEVAVGSILEMNEKN